MNRKRVAGVVVFLGLMLVGSAWAAEDLKPSGRHARDLLRALNPPGSR